MTLSRMIFILYVTCLNWCSLKPKLGPQESIGTSWRSEKSCEPADVIFTAWKRSLTLSNECKCCNYYLNNKTGNEPQFPRSHSHYSVRDDNHGVMFPWRGHWQYLSVSPHNTRLTMREQNLNSSKVTSRYFSTSAIDWLNDNSISDVSN